MKIIKNIEIKGRHKRPVLTDLFYKDNGKSKKIVVFCHGYKGYKDWGAWNLVGEKFAEADIFFLKMNFSHNGGTTEQPIDFPDLEAFGQNNFIIELDDLDSVLTWIHSTVEYHIDMDLSDITVIGHSRGGGIVALKACSDDRISRMISWAGVSDFASRFPTGEVLQQWKENGVAYITNGRTNQQMPHYFQFYTTFKENEPDLTIRTALKKRNVPYLIIHGSEDETVTLQEAENLHSWALNGKLKIIEGANHTFGSSQPWTSDNLPEDLNVVCKESIKFILG